MPQQQEVLVAMREHSAAAVEQVKAMAALTAGLTRLQLPPAHATAPASAASSTGATAGSAHPSNAMVRALPSSDDRLVSLEATMRQLM